MPDTLRPENIHEQHGTAEVRVGREAAIAALAYYGIQTCMPHIRGVDPRIGMVVGTVIFLLLSLAVICNIARWKFTWVSEVLLFGFPLVAWYWISGWAEDFEQARPFLTPLAAYLFLVACAFLGRIISRLIRDANMLVPIAVVLFLVDIFTVFVGPTGEALDKAPGLVEKFSIGLPEMGSAAEGAEGFGFIANAGLGDFIFMSFFFALIWRFDLRFRRTFLWMFGLLAAVMLSVLLFQAPPVPLLPFIAVGFLMANAGKFSFTRQERRDLLIALVFIAVLLGAGMFLMKSIGA